MASGQALDRISVMRCQTILARHNEPEEPALCADTSAVLGTQTSGYMKPPQEIIDLVDIPPEPNLSFSPDRTKVLQLYKPSPLPPISEFARPELKLAGMPRVSLLKLIFYYCNVLLSKRSRNATYSAQRQMICDCTM